MRLAKQHLDIGLFTNDLPAHLAFWSGVVGLRLDHELALADGWVQHRFDANGSVVKVNHWTQPLPVAPPSGYTALTIAGNGPPRYATHPDGDRVAVVAPGTADVVGIGVEVRSPQPGRLLDFYRRGLEFEQVGPDRARCGDTLLSFVDGPGNTADDLPGPGFRYLTVQVFDADAELAGIVDRGGRIVREAVSFAGVARFGFVADPDGNWIEISARTSLTGVEVR